MVIQANHLRQLTGDAIGSKYHIRINECMLALKELSKNWLLADVAYAIAGPVIDRIIFGWRPTSTYM